MDSRRENIGTLNASKLDLIAVPTFNRMTRLHFVFASLREISMDFWL